MGTELNKWQLLPLKKKNELLNLYVKNGYTNLNAIKLHYNLFADGGFAGNYGEVSPEIKHDIQHMNQPYFYNNNPTNTVHKGYFSYFDHGGFMLKEKDLQNLHTVFGIN